jgi:F0F1-type ATP synthase assembly protein I
MTAFWFCFSLVVAFLLGVIVGYLLNFYVNKNTLK